MNKADKIKALLADSSINRVSIDVRSGGYCSYEHKDATATSTGKIMGYKNMSQDWAKEDGVYFSHKGGGDWTPDSCIKRIKPIFRSWSQINQGDLVMTPSGAGRVCSIFNDRAPYYVQFVGAGGIQFERHELALLERGGDSE